MSEEKSEYTTGAEQPANIIDRCRVECNTLLFIDDEHGGSDFHEGEIELYREAVRLREERDELQIKLNALLVEMVECKQSLELLRETL